MTPLLAVIRYVYQFPGVGDEVQRKWPSDAYITPLDFDLELYSSRQLFVGLLGNTAVLVIAIITWNRFRATDAAARIGKQGGKTALQDNHEGASLAALALLRRLLILHANKLTGFIIFGACAAAPSALNLVYLVCLVATVHLPRGTDHIGGFVYLWTCAVMLAQNLFRFSYWCTRNLWLVVSD